MSQGASSGAGVFDVVLVEVVGGGIFHDPGDFGDEVSS